MQLKKLLSDDDAVSPVIGVILMVAITVILAAVIASFVLGMGNNMGNSAPQASFEWDYTNNSNESPGDVLELSHASGQSVDASALNLTVSDANIMSDTDGDLTNGFEDNYGQEDWQGNAFGGSGSVSAGDTYVVDGGGDGSPAQFHYGSSGTDFDPTTSDHLDLSRATVKFIWTASDGSTSTTLDSWEGPEA